MEGKDTMDGVENRLSTEGAPPGAPCVQVLDHGYVALLDHMGSESTILNAARQSYATHQRSNLTPQDIRLVLKLLEQGHNTPFEHCILQWQVHTPIFIARQWMRHRVGQVFNETSFRYTMAQPEWYTPKFADPEKTKKYNDMMQSEIDLYNELTGNKTKKEVARGILGTAFYTTFYWTVNLWSFIHWYRMRSSAAAQWEHQEYARAAMSLAYPLFPNVLLAVQTWG